MRDFTRSRTADTADELWLLEHPPVFTLGVAGRSEHIHAAGDVPVVRSDRGGQVTYHGPGQLIVYLLLDLHRHGLAIRRLVRTMEQAMIRFLDRYDIEAQLRGGAPGIYVGELKIGAVGLRVHKGCSYHGLSLNWAPDLRPFLGIDPCGHRGLKVTSVRELLPGRDIASMQDDAGRALSEVLAEMLGYNT